MRAQREFTVPVETARVARAAFPRGNAYIRLSDTLGSIFNSAQFLDLYSQEGQPAEDPARLALVTIFPFAEGLTDRQAADAVRSRIDGKYILCLPLEDAGFDASVLSEFRSRLLGGQAERRLFDTVLEHLKAHGFVRSRGRQRRDSTHVLASIHVLNRWECVGEAPRQVLNTVAVVAPDWLRGWVPGNWFDRYSKPFQDSRLPKGKEERQARAEHIGADGQVLLGALSRPENRGAPAWLQELPQVDTLRCIWVQQFSASAPGKPVRWRVAADLPPASLMISSPHDPDARYSLKRGTEWTGDKVHLTETCEPDSPNLITDVATAPAPSTDHSETAAIQDRLAVRGLLPREHIVDTADVTSDLLVNSQAQHGCTLLGPVAEDDSWQARQETGYAVAQFVIDWEAQQATCPEGKTSTVWKLGVSSLGHESVTIRFAQADCAPCPVRQHCISHNRPRALMVRRQPEFVAVMAARRRQTTAEFRREYARRPGWKGQSLKVSISADYAAVGTAAWPRPPRVTASSRRLSISFASPPAWLKCRVP